MSSPSRLGLRHHWTIPEIFCKETEVLFNKLKNIKGELNLSILIFCDIMCRVFYIVDTLKFYKALSQIGTDFTLMAKVFNNHTRNELKVLGQGLCNFGKHKV